MTERGYRGVTTLGRQLSGKKAGRSSRWEAYGRSEIKGTDKGWKKRL